MKVLLYACKNHAQLATDQVIRTRLVHLHHIGSNPFQTRYSIFSHYVCWRVPQWGRRDLLLCLGLNTRIQFLLRFCYQEVIQCICLSQSMSILSFLSSFQPFVPCRLGLMSVVWIHFVLDLNLIMNLIRLELDPGDMVALEAFLWVYRARIYF